MKSPFLGLGSEAALRHFSDALADGVFTTDAEGRITYWNAAAERLTGWTAKDALGANCSLLAGDVVNGCSCGAGPVRCGLALNGRDSKQCTTRTKDGRFLVIVKSAVPIRDASGDAVGALESFTPVQDEEQPLVPIGGGLAGLVGQHPAMLDLYRMIRLVASSSATVLITGESGSGKDLVAEAIHKVGPRATRPLVRVSCAVLEQLLALDGSVVRGGPSPNPLEASCGGTLVLDEIGDLTPAAQLRLLRYLEAREARRAMVPPDESCEVRVLCTTHADMRRAVDEGRFRADLFFRLNVFPLRVPALRERLEDAPLIAQHLLRRRRPPVELAEETGYALMAYRWPGNVRELENALEYAVLRSAGGPILPSHLPPEFTSSPLPPVVDERSQLAEALARCGGSRTLAAKALGISRVTLWKRMKKYGVLEGGDA